ncbi:hypothetical protein D2V93_05395 [Flagellimonas taeanensis]|uniref:hypothetical protein n=1 Tax=Flavobacteriaceae TaxID=49546 RepID=UPI000E67E546|nr:MULTISPECIES: hypothetical protein [Allomuricauda]MDC6386507.1 hypothetical protein [Muricauda sp. SK9]RIV52086.1 hypothetical protein D2V93_05395 [Allomuricauda taeanensis]
METKKILIPTDFSVKSLELVRKAIVETGDQPLEIVLLHGTILSNSITDLLFFSKTRLVRELQSKEFVEACTVLKNKYPAKIHSLYVEVITSNSSAYIKNFVDATQISEIFVPPHGVLNFKGAKGFDTLPLFPKCGVPCFYLDQEKQTEGEIVGKKQFANVFLSGLK